MLKPTNRLTNSINTQIASFVQRFHHIIVINKIAMSSALRQTTKPFAFGISKIMNRFKYLVDIFMVCVPFNCHHLMVVDIFAPDLVTKLFVCGILKRARCRICVDFSSLSSGFNVFGGSGYTICSGSYDKTIRMWDMETTKALTVIKGHNNFVMSIKCGSNINNCERTLLSGSDDKTVRLWDTRSGQEIQIFKGHQSEVWCVEYLPSADNTELGNGSTIVCSGSCDNTIRFWDIRTGTELHMIRGDDKNDCGIRFIKFLSLNKDKNNRNSKHFFCHFKMFFFDFEKSKYESETCFDIFFINKKKGYFLLYLHLKYPFVEVNSLLDNYNSNIFIEE
ncbi:hypothetical protein RFI_32107 [Reticulomyxa filosa]|uniref:Uncharacterized protein n=1 Tax=Reticulomyxa filosa TaxID=46433 RepID=X6LX25_RETFI|nr:hypothetical protein RFI_32107 [Reticulomyxa filosa]|eukprot:ETO05290.1 hypothetical protein RFI_32107 [Reticulomyxa filosa]